MKPECLPEQLLCSWLGCEARADEGLGGTCARRQMRAAFEIGLAPPRFGQHRRGRRDMARLAAVRGAGERQFGIAEAVAVGGAALDQRQGLQRLDGGARKDAPADVADRRPPLAAGIDHGDGAAMEALDQRAAGDFDEDRDCSCAGSTRAASQAQGVASAASRTSSRLEKQKRTKWRGRVGVVEGGHRHGGDAGLHRHALAELGVVLVRGRAARCRR